VDRGGNLRALALCDILGRMDINRLHQLSDQMSATAAAFRALDDEFPPGHVCKSVVSAASAAVAQAYESVNAEFVKQSQPKNPGAEA